MRLTDAMLTDGAPQGAPLTPAQVAAQTAAASAQVAANAKPVQFGNGSDAAMDRKLEAINKDTAGTTTASTNTGTIATKFAKAGTFIGWDYQNNTQTTGTLRRKIVADGKGGQKIDLTSTEKNPDYVSGSRNPGGAGGGAAGGAGLGGKEVFHTVGGVLYFGTTPFTGANGGKNYKAGVLVPDIIPPADVKPTTNIDVMKATLRGLGFTSAIIDSSTAFLNSLLREGLDYDNATEIFLNSKEYTLKSGTKISSPFYTEYGYLNEGLTVPQSANDIFNTVEGFKGVIDKYKLSSKYLTQDSLKKYFKNGITVTDLAQRASTSQLRALEADPFQVDALVKQGYIGSAADLTDFYMDPNIGQQQLELNKQTGVFTAEALRRSKAGVITTGAQLSNFKQITLALAARGYSEGEIGAMAATGFKNIAENLGTTTKLSQIYRKAGGDTRSNAALGEQIQQDLLDEEFKNMPSAERKKLKEQEEAAYKGSAGMYNRLGVSGSLGGGSTAGIL